jgi:hypothetical protein
VPSRLPSRARLRVDRDRVRPLVRAELERVLGSPTSRGDASTARGPKRDANAAEEEIFVGDASACIDDMELAAPRSCVIEPGRPCIQSGYCKKLGY